MLDDIYWSFPRKRRDPPLDLAAFVAAVDAYQQRISPGRSQWRPTAIATPLREIRIGWMAWEGERQVDRVATLRTDNAEGFTQAELLWRIDEHLAGEDLGDHVFFEGLSGPSARGTYFLALGS